MNNYHFLVKRRQLLAHIVFLLLAITSCNGTARVTPSVPPTLNTSTQTSVISNIKEEETQEKTVPPVSNRSSTAFIETTDRDESYCGRFDDAGHILFLTDSADVKFAESNFDLYVMNGNGCFPSLVMKNVSGSPAWSKHGNQIAIGCEENTSICILDGKTTLLSCVLPENKEHNQCKPETVKKIKLPPEISGKTGLVTLSWSSDGSQIAVEGKNNQTEQYSIYIHSLMDEGEWQMLVNRNFPYYVDWSPSGNQLAVTGTIIDLGDTEHIQPLIPGFDPVWSPDGKRLAVIIPSEDKSNEPFGIGVVHVGKEGWNWLYKPAIRKGPTRDIIVNTSGEKRVLSWSPDERYLAFVSLYHHSYDSQIFRLDLSSGEVRLLTTKFTTRENGHYCYAPAWGP